MSEKVKKILQSDKIKNISKKIFNKKIFNKKTFIAGVIIIVFISAAKIGFKLAFEVDGTVTKIDGSNITVTNFFTTQTINVGNYPISNLNLQVGDRIEISKNLSGQVYSIRGDNYGHMINGNKKNNGNERFNRNGKFNGNQKSNEGNMKR